jgi:hypothetical protein
MTSPATSTRLPQELIDSIIDELRNDICSLRTCSLVSKPWVYRSRKYLFATVRLPTCLLRKWLECIPADPTTPLGPHYHARSLSIEPATASAAFCIPKTFVDHLSSFTQVSKLAIASSRWEEWTDAFSDSGLVAKYFGGFGRSVRKLELTRVYLNMVALEALLDVFPRLEQILIFWPMMVNEEAKCGEVFPRLRERRNVAEDEDLESNLSVVPSYKKVSSARRWVNSVTLFFPPRELVLGLVSFPLRCRELVLTDSEYDGDTLNLMLDSTGPTLESLSIRNSFDEGVTPLPFPHYPIGQ